MIFPLLLTCAREVILKATEYTRRQRVFANEGGTMEAVGTNSAVVAWKLDSPVVHIGGSWNNDQPTWDDFRQAINGDQTLIDNAVAAILSGPIRFNLNASQGNGMLLPHLAMVKTLTETLGNRAVLNLHDGDLNSAWTNLLAATRLVTAWDTEPVEISQLVRFTDTGLVFDTLWQALQTNGWTDGQLARLQAEWESANFFTNLPETAAFKRTSDAALCKQARQAPMSAPLLSPGIFPQLLRARTYSGLNSKGSAKTPIIANMAAMRMRKRFCYLTATGKWKLVMPSKLQPGRPCKSFQA